MDIYQLYCLVDKYGEHGLQEDTVDVVLEVIEKQIPKKPEKQDENCLECPNCDSFIAFESEARDDTNYQDEYCRNCGQAIDWE